MQAILFNIKPAFVQASPLGLAGQFGASVECATSRELKRNENAIYNSIPATFEKYLYQFDHS